MSWLKALTCSDSGYCHRRKDEPVRQFVLYEKEFWLDGCLGFEPRVMGSLLLKASTTWGKSFWLSASIIGVNGPCPFF
jgi:hypothetical protein